MLFDPQRLATLQARFAAEPLPFAQGHWATHLATVDLNNFRGQHHYLYQQPTIDLYTTMVERLRREDDWQLLDTLTEDDAFGAFTFQVGGQTVSRDLLDSIDEITYLRTECGWQRDQAVNVLDIGAGYGRLAHRLCASMPNAQVWSTDAVAESMWLAESYLTYRGVEHNSHVVPWSAVPRLKAIHFDAATAIHSWSECTPLAIHWWASQLKFLDIPVVLYVGMARGEEQISEILAEYGYDLYKQTTADLDNLPFLQYRLHMPV